MHESEAFGMPKMRSIFVHMGDFEKHFRLMNEKKDTAYGAFEKHNNSSVGDEAIKVVEQALEADAFRFSKRHLGDHEPRFSYARKLFPRELFEKMRKLWFAYEDLGYDGINGFRARHSLFLMNSILEFFEKRWGVSIGIRKIE